MAMTETEFVAALRALGPRGAEDTFDVIVDGVTVAVRYVSGSSSHLLFTTAYVGRKLGPTDDYRGLDAPVVARRPMEIELRPERPADVSAKEDGISVEAQTGDAAFDDEVYIDTKSTADVVRRVLSHPTARAAVRALLARRVAPITLDTRAGAIEARIDHFDRTGTPQAVLADLVALATHLPDVRDNGELAPADPAKGLLALTAMGALFGLVPLLVTMFFALPSRCYSSDDEGISLSCTDPDCCVPMFGGLAVGLAAGAILGLFAASRVRGTSDAHQIRGPLGICVAALVLEVTMIVGHLVAAVALR